MGDTKAGTSGLWGRSFPSGYFHSINALGWGGWVKWATSLLDSTLQPPCRCHQRTALVWSVAFFVDPDHEAGKPWRTQVSRNQFDPLWMISDLQKKFFFTSIRRVFFFPLFFREAKLRRNFLCRRRWDNKPEPSHKTILFPTTSINTRMKALKSTHKADSSFKTPIETKHKKEPPTTLSLFFSLCESADSTTHLSRPISDRAEQQMTQFVQEMWRFFLLIMLPPPWQMTHDFQETFLYFSATASYANIFHRCVHMREGGGFFFGKCLRFPWRRRELAINAAATTVIKSAIKSPRYMIKETHKSEHTRGNKIVFGVRTQKCYCWAFVLCHRWQGKKVDPKSRMY